MPAINDLIDLAGHPWKDGLSLGIRRAWASGRLAGQRIIRAQPGAGPEGDQTSQKTRSGVRERWTGGSLFGRPEDAGLPIGRRVSRGAAGLWVAGAGLACVASQGPPGHSVRPTLVQLTRPSNETAARCHWPAPGGISPYHPPFLDWLCPGAGARVCLWDVIGPLIWPPLAPRRDAHGTAGRETRESREHTRGGLPDGSRKLLARALEAASGRQPSASGCGLAAPSWLRAGQGESCVHQAIPSSVEGLPLRLSVAPPSDPSCMATAVILCVNLGLSWFLFYFIYPGLFSQNTQ